MKSYAIADIDAMPDENQFLKALAEIADAGVDTIQLRAKSLEGRDLMRLAERCRAAIPSTTLFLVNGRTDVAVACGADGVHLPSAGLPASAVRAISPSLVVGRSCHSLSDVARAKGERADYILLGPVFATRSKSTEGRISSSNLRSAAAEIPTFALGGISRDNIAQLRGLGLAGVAAITMFMSDRPLEPIVSAVRAM